MSLRDQWMDTIREAAEAKGSRFCIKHVDGKEIVQVGDPNGRYLELLVATRTSASPAEAEFVKAATHPNVALICTASDNQQMVWSDTTDEQRQLDALVTWVLGGHFDPRVLPTTTAT